MFLNCLTFTFRPQVTEIQKSLENFSGNDAVFDHIQTLSWEFHYIL